MGQTWKEQVDESIRRWKEDQANNGWVLPKAAPWFLRVAPFRWIRGFYNAWRVHRHADQWASVGIGVGGPSAYDRWVLFAIWQGWC